MDLGSLNQAAEVLYVAQSALSQQLSTLEGEMKQTLLVRSKKGVVPTEAGKVLYKHAQNILRQYRLAKDDVQSACTHLTGAVSVGLAQFSMASSLAARLVRRVRETHPGILLHLNENSSVHMSELILSGRIDLALIGANLYGVTPPHGLSFTPLFDEALVLLAPRCHFAAEVVMRDLSFVGLVLSGPNHFLRRLVDDSFAKLGLKPVVVGETTSMATLTEMVLEGVGVTILPESVASNVARHHEHLSLHPLLDPVDLARLSMCKSELQPLSRAAEFVRATLEDLVDEQRISLKDSVFT